jgi:uncharacterized surface protein with fasciclin (FAS1) repeats
MKTRTQLLVGLLGLSAFISLPTLAQSNSVKGSLDSTPAYTSQTVPGSPNRPVEDGKTPNSPVKPVSVTKNLVEQAASNNQFQTLAKAIKVAGLEQTLAGKGPYTVFAPTDAAFAALPKEAVEQLLLPENKEILMQLLSYHVVPGAVTSSQIQPGQVETLAGEPVTVQRSADGSVTINNAKVTQADIQASNGVIHGVDQVILPPEAKAQLKQIPKSVSQN